MNDHPVLEQVALGYSPVIDPKRNVAATRLTLFPLKPDAAPPAAEWGSMMSGARNLLQTAPWTVFVPGAAIFTTVALFQLFADSLRDLADAKTTR